MNKFKDAVIGEPRMINPEWENAPFVNLLNHPDKYKAINIGPPPINFEITNPCQCIMTERSEVDAQGS